MATTASRPVTRRSRAGGRARRISARELTRRARLLEWVLLDVDGVLTDGRLYYGAEGEAFKAFHVRDGLALKLAQRAGLKIGLLSARSSRAVGRRARELGFDAVVQGRRDKLAAFEEFLRRQRALPERVAFAGDDLPDLPLCGRVGLFCAPADAAREVRDQAELLLKLPGGGGAVRELIERLLKARGIWEEIVGGFAPGSF